MWIWISVLCGESEGNETFAVSVGTLYCQRLTELSVRMRKGKRKARRQIGKRKCQLTTSSCRC
jgi:hypothetical protein